MIYKRSFDILKAHRTMGESECAIFTYFTHRMKSYIPKQINPSFSCYKVQL